MKVHVEQRHIDAGKPDFTSECPVAMAIRETTGQEVRVYTGSVVVTHRGGERQVLIVPSNVVEFIRAFDDGNPVEPFEFDLPIGA